MEVDRIRFTSMEVSGSFHGIKVSTDGGGGSFHCFHQLQLPRPHSVKASMSFHVPLYTSTSITNFQLLPQDVHKGSPTSIWPTVLPWKFPPTSMKASMETWICFHQLPWNYVGSRLFSMEVDGSWFFRSMEVNLLPWKLPRTSKEVSWKKMYFHESHQKPPWKYMEVFTHGGRGSVHWSIAVSTTLLGGGFHQPRALSVVD